MKGWRIIGVLVAVLCCQSPLLARSMSRLEYGRRLEELRGVVAARKVVEAKTLANALLTDRVIWEKTTLATDASVLKEIANATRPEDLFVPQKRLDALVRALSDEAIMAARPADPQLLNRLRLEQEQAQLPGGGKVPTVPTMDENTLQAIARQIGQAWKTIARFVRKFFDWLVEFIPSRSSENAESETSGLSTFVAVMIAAIAALLIGLTVSVMRRSSRHEPMIGSEQVPPQRTTRDADPMSRAANEWEAYARELTRTGQIREAIRAWYHAVLVASYRSGTIHYRKGRTNWEYVASLPPTIGWRDRFVSVTRVFEREWYGRDRSNVDALDLCAAEAKAILRELSGGSR